MMVAPAAWFLRNRAAQHLLDLSAAAAHVALLPEL